MPWKVTIEYETETRSKTFRTEGQAISAEVLAQLVAAVLNYTIVNITREAI